MHGLAVSQSSGLSPQHASMKKKCCLVIQFGPLCACHAVHFKHIASWLQLDDSAEKIKKHRKRTPLVLSFFFSFFFFTLMINDIVFV